jgi:REP element-mobilizing transposase RayT
MVRVEPFSIDSYIHVVKRGARGMPITQDTLDKERFLQLLFYMNDSHLDQNWGQINGRGSYLRPETWPERKPIVSILAFTLMPNHMHLLLKETQEGGASLFIQKLSQSMTNFHNDKYHEKGSIFQGPYRSRTILDDTYMRYVLAYILVKNVFELFPGGGMSQAKVHFEEAWAWARNYNFSSFGDFVNNKSRPITDTKSLEDFFKTSQEFKVFSRDVISAGNWDKSNFE